MFDEIRNEIKLESAGTASFELEAFVRVFAKHLEDSEMLLDTNVEILSAKGPRGKRLEFVGYAEDQTDDSLTILAAKYFGQDETLILTEAKEVMNRAKSFLEHSIDGWLEQNLEISSREVEYASYFAGRFSRYQVSKVKIVLLTDGFMSDRIKTLESDYLGKVKVTYEIWDQKRVLDSDLPDLGSEDILVDFTKWLPTGLPCLEAKQGDKSTKTLLAVIPAKILAEIFDEYGSLLLESNVRTFLSARGAVNKGIQATLAQEPTRFLAYNNGLTTTATDVSVVDSSAGKCIQTIKRWQIVNGGQTTASIVHFLRADKTRTVDDVHVQMKLVIVEDSESSEVVQSVAKYANSQNKVTAADLFATHDFHVRMEQISRRLKASPKEGQQYQTSWYYERARGQWENDRNSRGSLAEQKKFLLEYPKSQRITKPAWAKYEYCWAQKPHLVSRGAETVFADFAVATDNAWQKDDTLFNDGYFVEGVAKTILYEELRANVLKEKWYQEQQGYLANIIAYAISRFSLAIATDYPGFKYDFRKVWQSQSVPGSSMKDLVAISKQVQKFLNEPRPQGNITQWAKQLQCWERFIQVPVSISNDTRHDLISSIAAVETSNEQKNQRKIDNEVEGAIRILRISPTVWDTVENHTGPVSKSPMESDLLKLFRPGSGKVPTEKQANALLRLFTRFIENGVIKGSDV